MKDHLYLLRYASILLVIGVALLWPVFSQGAEWQKFDRIPPVQIMCPSEAAAKLAAEAYCRQVCGIKVYQVPATFSMSRTSLAGDFYVLERVPYAEAGGMPAVFWQNSAKLKTVRHYLVARDAKGRYISQGDGPRNVGHNDTNPVTPDLYFGAVKTNFTWPRK